MHSYNLHNVLLLYHQYMKLKSLGLAVFASLILSGCRLIKKPTPAIQSPTPSPTPQDQVAQVYISSGAELVSVTTPQANTTVSNPLVITGMAPGYWFFEATAPIMLTNWDGLIIAEGYITATEDRMTG